MRAIRIAAHGAADVLRLEQVAAPVPGEGEALVRVAAAGVNFIDVYFRTGQYTATLPYTPGSEASGTVEAVGPGVTGVAPGDRVATIGARGAYAELTVVPAAALVPVPDGMDLQLAAAVMLQGMTAHFLTRSAYALAPGDTCVVHAAAGGVGLLLCQLARASGATVIGVASTEAKAAAARAAGAHHVLDTRDDLAAEVRRLTGGRGAHVVYDSVGRDTFDASLDSLALRGMLVLFGQSSGAVGPFDPQVLNRKGSLFLTRPTLFHYVATREELLARAADVLGAVAAGRLAVRVHRVYPLADAAEAHADLESRRTSGKLLLVP